MLSYDLSQASWGITSDPSQQLTRIAFFEQCMRAIVGKIFKQGLDEVSVALQLVVLLKEKDTYSKYYGNAMKIMHTNYLMLDLALEKICAHIKSQDEKILFLNMLEKMAQSIKTDRLVFPLIMHFLQKQTLFNALRTDLKKYIPFPLHLSDILSVNVRDTIYSFNIEYNVIAVQRANGRTIIIPACNDQEKIEKFIALRVLASILSVEYQESLSDLITLSFEDFCNPEIPIKEKNYQYAAVMMLRYFEIKNIIIANDKTMAQQNNIDPKWAQDVLYLKELTQSFEIFIRGKSGVNVTPVCTQYSPPASPGSSMSVAAAASSAFSESSTSSPPSSDASSQFTLSPFSYSAERLFKI